MKLRIGRKLRCDEMRQYHVDAYTEAKVSGFVNADCGMISPAYSKGVRVKKLKGN